MNEYLTLFITVFVVAVAITMYFEYFFFPDVFVCFHKETNFECLFVWLDYILYAY